MNDTTKRPARRWLRWGVLPLVLMGGAELRTRSAFSDVSLEWYDENLREPSSLEGEFLFVGSSISACAINDPVFEKVMRQNGRDVRVFNRAMGGATLPLHVIALRSLLKGHPDALRDTQVIFELPRGLPFHYHPDELASHRDYLVPSSRLSQLYLSVAAPSELRELWTDHLALETRLGLSVRLATRELALSRWRERARQAILDEALEVTKSVARAMGADPDARDKPIGALIERGGIRNDPAFAARIKQMLERFSAEERFQAAYPPWEESQVAELLDLVEGAGGTVWGYDPPLHSSYASLLERENTRNARTSLAAYLEMRGVPILRPAFNAKDAFFPDAFHLAKVRAPKFTKALVEAWVAAQPD